MDEIIQYILELVNSLPLHSQLLIVLLIFPIFYAIYRIIKDEQLRKDIISFTRKTTFKTEIDKETLLKHDIFLSIPLFKRYIANINFTDVDKDWLFDTILTIKMNTIIEHSKLFISKLNKDYSHIEIKASMETLINEIVEAYEFDIEQAFITKYNKRIGTELYNYVYKAFADYHQTNVTFILKAIDSLSISEVPNNYKLYSFLSIMKVAIDLAIYDCEDTFRGFNGHIQLLIHQI